VPVLLKNDSEKRPRAWKRRLLANQAASLQNLKALAELQLVVLLSCWPLRLQTLVLALLLLPEGRSSAGNCLA
jgi:hypothetical protein